jgi:hypothetical protein
LQAHVLKVGPLKIQVHPGGGSCTVAGDDLVEPGLYKEKYNDQQTAYPYRSSVPGIGW